MYNKTQREHYNQDRAIICRDLGITENDYNWFRRIGQQLHTIYEDQCNGLTEEGEAEAGAKEQDLNDKANKKAKELGLFIHYQTDPRGAAIYLDKKEIPDNNYNRAHCIY